MLFYLIAHILICINMVGGWVLDTMRDEVEAPFSLSTYCLNAPVHDAA